MAVVESDSVEDTSSFGDVSLHVFPEERTVGWTGSVAELHVVAPRDQLTAQINV